MKNLFQIGIVLVIILSTLNYGCGVSDYINRKKIANAPKPEESRSANTPHTRCANHTSRIDRIVKYLNRVRTRQQVCGEKTYSAAPKIAWNKKLYAAAQTHSSDMAVNNLLSHTGSDNSNVSARIESVGYSWNAVAENISGGTITPEQTIDRWMVSPGHCHNLMNAKFSEIGMACAVNQHSDYEIYWTIVLANAP